MKNCLRKILCTIMTVMLLFGIFIPQLHPIVDAADISALDIGSIFEGNVSPLSTSQVIVSGYCGENGDNLTWKLDSAGVLTISGKGKMKDYFAEQGSFPCHPWSFELMFSDVHCNKIVVEEGVTSVTAYAFVNFTGKTVELADSLTEIHGTAFLWNNTIETINVPVNLGELNSNFICELSALKNLTVNGECKNYYVDENCALYTKDKRELCGIVAHCKNLCLPKETEVIKFEAFENNKSLEAISVENGNENFKVKDNVIYVPSKENEYGYYIQAMNGAMVPVSAQVDYAAVLFYPSGRTDETYNIEPGTLMVLDHAFANSKLKNINIPDSVYAIGSFAFMNCTNLESIVIPSTVTKFEISTEDECGSWFSGCTSLKEVTLPEGPEELVYTFLNCTSLETVIIPKSVKSLYGTFAGSGIKSITLHEGIEYIEYATFSNTGITKILFPESLRAIHERAFAGCSNLQEVKFNDGLKEIKDSAFIDCYKLKNIELPSSLVNIGDYAFNTLESVVIPSSLKYMGAAAFGYSVKDFYYQGNALQFAKINSDNENKIVYAETTVHFIDGSSQIGLIGKSYPTKINFGYYPQTLITDKNLIKNLDSAVNKWVAFDQSYYSSGQCVYTDVDYLGDRYRGIKFDSFRTNAHQEDNGYELHQVYWFKFEPITWKILDNNTGLLVCDMAIDCMNFTSEDYYNASDPDRKHFINDYSISYVRKWLNADFFSTAFSEQDKLFIDSKNLQTSTVEVFDNTLTYSKYTFETKDNVFLLSYFDLLNENYGFNSQENKTDENKVIWPTDYSAAMGSFKYSWNGSTRVFLRNPGRFENTVTGCSGSVDKGYGIYECYGISPAIYINDIDSLVYKYHNHVAATEVIVENRVEPTCKVKGSYDEVVYCAICDIELSRSTEEIPATGHNWDNGTITTTATCNVKGVKTYTCEYNPEHTYTEYLGINVSNHVNTKDIAEIKATCTTKGSTAGVYCNDCKKYISGHVEIPVDTNAHNWDNGTITTTATCKVSGVKTYTCQHNASHKKTENLGVNASNHVNTKNLAEVKATCTTKGSTAGVYCNDCKKYISGHVEIPVDANAHKWDNGTITTVATCKVTGVKTYTCQHNSSHTYTENLGLNASNHVNTRNVAEVKATCTTKGSTAGVYCNDCQKYISGHTEIDAKGHTSVTDKAVAATCTTAGKTEGSHCSVCNAVIKAQENIPAKGHTAVTDKAVAATCTTTGKTEGKHCSVCNTIITAQKNIPATGHKWNNGVITTAATCKAKGVKTYTCQNDASHKKTEDIAVNASNHVNTKNVPETPATFENVGYTAGVYCNDCKKYISGHVEIPKLVPEFTDSKDAKESGNNIVSNNGLTVAQLLSQAGKGAVIKTSDGKSVENAALIGTGMVLTMADGSKKEIVVYGDVDGDGKISAADARQTLRASVGLENFKEDSAKYKAAKRGNVDKLSAADARLILRASVGLENPKSWLK